MNKRHKKLLVCLALILSLFTSSTSLAQNSSSATNDWTTLKSLSAGSNLSVKLKTGNKISGTFINASDTDLTLTSNSKSQIIKREDVQSVHQVTKHSAAASTLIGMGIGAGAGAGLGAIGSENDSSGFEKLDHAVTAGLAVAGAGIGAVTGYLLGRGKTKKVLLYEYK